MASGQLKRLSFMVDASLFDAIELARGDVARERWLRRAVEQALGEASGADNADVPRRGRDHGVDPSPAPAEQLEKVDRILMNAAREFRPYPKGGK